MKEKEGEGKIKREERRGKRKKREIKRGRKKGREKNKSRKGERRRGREKEKKKGRGRKMKLFSISSSIPFFIPPYLIQSSILLVF